MWLIGIISKYWEYNKEGGWGSGKDSPSPTLTPTPLQSFGTGKERLSFLSIWDQYRIHDTLLFGALKCASVCLYVRGEKGQERKPRERERERQDLEWLVPPGQRLPNAHLSPDLSLQCWPETMKYKVNADLSPQWEENNKNNLVAFPHSQDVPHFLKIMGSSLTQLEY